MEEWRVAGLNLTSGQSLWYSSTRPDPQLTVPICRSTAVCHVHLLLFVQPVANSSLCKLYIDEICLRAVPSVQFNQVT
jgi:hypothetical protein